MFSHLSLKAKLLTLVVLVVATMGLLSLFIVNKLQTSAEEDGLKSFQTYAEGLSASIQAQFFERYGDIQAFASNGILQSNNSQKITKALNTYIQLHGIYDLIIMTDLEGKLIASSSVAPNGKPLDLSILPKSFGDQVWFQKVTSQKMTSDKNKGFSGTFVEDVHLDNITSKIYKKKMYGNSFSSFVKDSNGNNIGVLTAKAGWRWVEYEFIDWYKRLKTIGLGTSELTMLNKKGEVIIDYDPTAKKSAEIIHDFDNVLLKLNLADKGVGSAVQARNGKIGSSYSSHARKKVEQIAGYAAIKGDKFVDSLGWSVLVRANKEEFLASLIQVRNLFYIVFAFIVLVVASFSYWLANKIGKSVQDVATNLSGCASKVLQASEEIADHSSKLSEASLKQSSSLQQTVASINQISAMIKRNSESADMSKETALKAKNEAVSGKDAVSQMIDAIEKIGQSNSGVQDQMGQINTELLDVVNVIKAIGEKTQVINDIVFQTKLLSFNASVEAARAGEHGKGFSVVAEEVGNLAQMSGTAADEIASMLEGSISQVENMVEKARTTVDALVLESNNRIDHGKETANKCGESISLVETNVNTVNSEVEGIATASAEQSHGVEEVNKAMHDLDKVTQINTQTSQESTSSAQGLKAQAETLRTLVSSLTKLVDGTKQHEFTLKHEPQQRRKTAA